MRTEAPTGAIPAAAPVAARRFGLNLGTNIGRLLLTMVIGVWYVPFLVKHIGPAAYGLIPLTSTITSYAALVTLGLNSAVGRYLTIALEQEDHRRANLFFNTSLWGSLGLTAVLLIPAALGVIYVDDIVRVPPGFETQARWLFAATAAAFLLNEIKTPFDVSSFSRNRFDLRNLVAIAELGARWGFVLLLFYLIAPAASYVGFGIFFGTLVSAVGAVWLWKRLTPTLRVSPALFDWSVLRELTTTGGWVIINQTGAYLFLSIDLIVANRLFGAELGGKYAAVLQVPILIRTLGGTVASVFGPTILYYFARQDLSGLSTYLARAMRCSGLLLALPISFTCGFARPLLSLWLGTGFGGLHLLLILMTAHLCINSPSLPLLGVQLPANKVKVPAVVTLIMGGCNLALVLFLAGPMHWGLYGIAAATAIMWIAKNVGFTPIYAAHILGRSSWVFYRELILIVTVTALNFLLCRLILQVWPVAHWPQLVLAGLGISAFYGFLVFRLLLTAREREMVRNLIPF